MERRMQKKLKSIAIISLVAAFSVVFGILFASKMNWTETSIAEGQDSSLKDVKYYPLTQDGESPFVAVAEMVKPAVVSIIVSI